MARSGQWLLTLTLLASAGGLIFGLLSPQDRIATDLPLKKAQAPVDDSGSEEQPVLTEAVSQPPPLSEFVEMTLRPLFSSSRRPPPASGEDVTPDTQKISAGPVETKQFMVMGIIIAPNEKVALLRQQNSSNEILHVKEGQKISDWTVSEITPESVIMQQGGVTDVVKLSDNILSAAEKMKLVQQAKRAQAKTANTQKLLNRRTQANNNRRNARQFTRKNNQLPQTGKNIIPGRTIKKPVR